MDCLFCKIINREEEAEIVYEDEKFLAFKDVNPRAPLHILLIPKKHIPSIDYLQFEDRELIGELLLTAQKVARQEGIASSGYKLAFNVGRGGGQIIDHLHLHLLGGWESKKEAEESNNI